MLWKNMYGLSLCLVCLLWPTVETQLCNIADSGQGLYTKRNIVYYTPFLPIYPSKSCTLDLSVFNIWYLIVNLVQNDYWFHPFLIYSSVVFMQTFTGSLGFKLNVPCLGHLKCDVTVCCDSIIEVQHFAKGKNLH